MAKLKERITQSTYAPTTFTDGVNIACRSDGGVLLQFISETPDCYIDNHRTVFTKEGITELIENLCSAINFYPTKKNEDEIQEKKKK